MTGLIYIVDDDKALRQTLAGLLSDTGFEIIECESAEVFMLIEPRYEPSCILLDVKMDGMSGFEMQAQLSKREFAPSIIFLTGTASLEQAVNAMRTGACHFLTKPVSDKQLINIVNEAIEQSSENASFFNFLQILTKTEQQIARLVRQGLPSKKIADELDVSHRTIDWHRMNISQKSNLYQQQDRLFKHFD